MMEDQFMRTSLVLGEEAMNKLFNAHVALFGAGGVGSYAAEALARAGIGAFSVFDGDTVCLSNINRQIIATHATVGMPKAEAAKRRILDINPNAAVSAHNLFYTKDNADSVDFGEFDYVIDAIDMVTSKILLAEKAAEYAVPIISSMGTGKKLDPTAFRVADIYKTSVCPLAKIMRKELRRRGIEHLKTVYSEEEPIDSISAVADGSRRVIGSVSFVPSVAGLIIAGEVIKDLVR